MANSRFSRREFISLTTAAAAMLGLSSCATQQAFGTKEPRKAAKIGPDGKVRIAQIGCGGKGDSDLRNSVLAGAEVVALCDIDWSLKRVKKMGEDFPNAKRYTDFRKMLLEMDGQIDAVNVSTPDHMHFLPAFMAMMMGKHVYVQKPLTQTVEEARELLRVARLTGVCTQMGNQGHAGDGIRTVREWMQAGVLGDVREVHIWTNRPVWPQGMQKWPDAEAIPEGLDWNQFIGRAEMKPFSSLIHPFKWRGYKDYGCGALGDMACHLMDCAFWNLDLGAPSSVELLQIDEASPVAFPKSATVRYEFPARGNMPAVTLTWYEGGKLPELKGPLAGMKLAKGGQILIGSKATMYDGNDYCNSPRLVPDAEWTRLKPTLPAKTLPRVPKGSPHIEWLEAIKAGKPDAAGSNFEYSVPFTEMVCLGTVAILVGKIGQKIKWDAAKRKTDSAEANAFLAPIYRKGWRPEEIL